MFRYTHALVCRVPVAFRTRAEIDLEEARRQHEALCRLLRELGVDVVELPPDELHPECVFVEDTAVICNGVALITRPGAPHRQGEVDTVRAVLKKELGLPIVEISDEAAKLDGGDVLFTGREFFVGLSEWTNEAGARALAASFPEFSVTPIKVSPGVRLEGGQQGHALQVSEPRHLKALVSMAAPDVLCVSKGAASQEVLRRIEREASFSYQTLTVPEDSAANVLSVNGTLIHRSAAEAPETCKHLEGKPELQRRQLSVSELAKVGAGLSSCCLLVRRTRAARTF
ncbi:N(G),N(G)-dimethylarginine dimethylaminohydrolase 1 isoform X1 [Cloeon dipterum]|uniref:Dimethylargininase n=1 Tax=Cloeon dipterum TaxID=197152 RepID=A0A8S1CZ05_9INSE|nr:Hypothetical predicted protein [Cloeon dipterum]